MKIVISEFVPPAFPERLREAGEVVADEQLWQARPRLLREVADADALIVRNQTRVDRELLAAASSLRVVGRLGVGLDNVDLAACRERGVPVVVARGANAGAVAEYVFAVMLAVSRRLAEATLSVRGGAWDRRRFSGTELAGRTLGIVGLGDIGTRLARRARAFGMRVLAFDPLATASWFGVAELSVELRDLPQLLEESDFVSLHLPLTPATRGLIGERELARMKPGAWLVNTARGGIVDEAALRRALEARRIGGAALDVREQEPPGPDDPLAALDNVILTPHVAGLTEESQAAIAAMVAEDVLRVLRGERPRNPAV